MSLLRHLRWQSLAMISRRTQKLISAAEIDLFAGLSRPSKGAASLLAAEGFLGWTEQRQRNMFLNNRALERCRKIHAAEYRAAGAVVAPRRQVLGLRASLDVSAVAMHT